MVKITHFRVMLTFLLAIGIILSIAGCGEGDTPQVQNTIALSYTLPLIPLTFSIDSNGHISVNVSAHIVTELGEIAVSAGSAIKAIAVPDNSILVTIRHKENGELVDSSYQVDTGGQGSIDVQGNISEVKIGWNSHNNRVFIDASNGDITSIVLQGAPSQTTTTATEVPTATPIPRPTATPSPTQPPPFQCPAPVQVSQWMNVNVSQVTHNDLCAFTAGNNGQILSRVVCTNQDGGTVIEFNTVYQPKVLVVRICSGNQLPDIYGFTIRFANGYSQDAASLCRNVAQQAPPSIPSDWIVQSSC